MTAKRPFQGVTRAACAALGAGLLCTAEIPFVWGSWISSPESVSLADERASWAMPQPPYRMVFYDNARYPVTPENGLPVAVWEQRSFLPFVTVDANLWVGVSALRAPSLESALADRIYANVQLRLILEEYERMQQRAREVLEGLGLQPVMVNLGSQLAGGLGPRERDPALSANEQAPSPKASETRLARLLASFREAMADLEAPSAAKGESSGGILWAMTASVSQAIAEREKREQPEAATAGGTGRQGVAEGRAEGRPHETQDVSRFGASVAEESGPVPRDMGSMTIPRPLQEEVPLPWVLRTALALFRLILAYKIEIFASVLILFTVFWILAAIVSVKSKRD